MRRYRSHAAMTMLPPPMDSSPVTPSGCPIIPRSLRSATARVLAGEARAAFDARDVALFEGTIDAIVELVTSPEAHRRQ
jgi:hypothetical protein